MRGKANRRKKKAVSKESKELQFNDFIKRFAVTVEELEEDQLLAAASDDSNPEAPAEKAPGPTATKTLVRISGAQIPRVLDSVANFGAQYIWFTETLHLRRFAVTTFCLTITISIQKVSVRCADLVPMARIPFFRALIFIDRFGLPRGPPIQSWTGDAKPCALSPTSSSPATLLWALSRTPY